MKYPYPEVGAVYKDGSCTFCTWAPLLKSVNLKLINSSQSLPMTQDGHGFWSLQLKDIAAGDRYQFVFGDQENPLPDPASRWQPDGVHAPSAVASKEFKWTDHAWKGIPLEQMIIYELHVGTFTKEGTFEGVVSKLDHLASLGINAIEIMPIAQFPGTRNWGYDGVFPFAVQNSYGGVEGLKKLVDEAHQRGVAIILDVVYNHQGPEGNYLEAYGPYFSDKYKTFWGKAINFDDAWCDGVRHFYLQNALQWLDEFHIDGLRLDAVHAIWDFGAEHFITRLTDHVRELEENVGRKKVLIAEFDLNNPRYITTKEKGGYGMDGQWIDEFHHALHALVTREVNGYYEDFGDIKHLTKSLKNSYVYTGEYSKHRKKYFGTKADDTTYGQFVVFSQNHDQIGNRLLGDRLGNQISFEESKLVASTLLLSPHVPLLFMGEEYGEKNPFQYFISHSDKTLIENVRKGRKEEFKYFGWSESVPDPQSESTFAKCILSWDLNKEENRKILSLYKYLIAFRKTHPAMKNYKRESLVVHDESGKLIVFERRSESDRLLILLNFNDVVAEYQVSPGRQLKRIFDSAQWDDSGEKTTPIAERKEMLQIAASSAQVYEYA
jgi:maltooligosyltrehalose trehalohydrolase